MARIRSPNYPQVDLKEAINLVSKIFDHEGQNYAPREVVVELLGYTSVNGASLKKIGAINAYGLLQRNSDREYRVSDLAVRLLHPADNQEELEDIKQAALSPNLFKEINERWNDRPPSDPNLRSYLIRNGFNQKSVDQVIAVYRSTMNFINVDSDIDDAADDENSIETSHNRFNEESLVHTQKIRHVIDKPIVFDMETISGQYSFDNSDDLSEFIEKLERIKPLLPARKTESEG